MHIIADASSLTDEERELIRAAVSNQGTLEIATRADTHGKAVVAGRFRFFSPEDRSVAARYVAVVTRLKELELIRPVADKHAYELTNFGWQLSRKLGR